MGEPHLGSRRILIIGGGGVTTEACVIAPSILIDDLELHPFEEELPKLPIAFGLVFGTGKRSCPL